MGSAFRDSILNSRDHWLIYAPPLLRKLTVVCAPTKGTDRSVHASMPSEGTYVWDGDGVAGPYDAKSSSMGAYWTGSVSGT
jgi:hypothetical protein